MLVLTAQIDRRRDGARQLAHARHAAVERDARTPIGRHAADGDELVRRGLICPVSRTDVLRPRACSLGIGRGRTCGIGDAFAIFRRLLMRTQAEEPARHGERVGALAHGGFVRALAHQQLER